MPAQTWRSTSSCGMPPIVSRRVPPKAGPTATTTSSGAPPRAEAPSSRRRPGPSARVDDADGRGVELVRERLQQRPALALEAVARARAAVVVGIVDGRVHRAGGVDHGRGLQVVGRDPLALHADDALGHLAEAPAVERECHVGGRDALGQHAVGGEHVLGTVAVGQVVARVARRGGGDLLVAHGREAELVEDGLDGAAGALAHGQHGVLRGGLDAGVDLPVALQRHPLVEVVGVVVAAAERVVVPRHDAVAGGHEIGSRQELPHQLGRAARGGVRCDGVVAGRDLEVQPGRDQVLGQDCARAAGQAHRQGDAGDGAVLHAL